VLDHGEPGVQTRAHQGRWTDEIGKPPGTREPGKLVEASHERAVPAPLGSTSTLVISAEPIGTWPHAVFDAAQACEQ
jgi:hypothetical protein